MTKVIGDYNAAVTIDGATNYLLIQPGSASTPYAKINRNTFLGVTGQPADLTTVQTLQNKVVDNSNTVTLKDTLFTLQDDGDTTKQARFQLSGITTATTRTYTLPNASSTLVDLSSSQTLTNKTLTSPTISGGSISNSTVAVDAIGEFTTNNGVTIDGLNIKDGALNTNNSVVTANITDTAVTPAKLQSGTGSGWSWQSWTPTWTNLTVGNGTVTANYIQTGKQVTASLFLTFGSTTSVSGLITFSLPVSGNARYSAINIIGNALLGDTGNANYPAAVNNSNATTAIINAFNASGTYTTYTGTSSTVPFTWGNGDTLSCLLFYEAA